MTKMVPPTVAGVNESTVNNRRRPIITFDLLVTDKNHRTIALLTLEAVGIYILHPWRQLLKM